MQLERRRALPEDAQEFLAPIHETTSAMYDAPEAAIGADPSFRAQENPRRLAVAVHMAGIGLVTMAGLADALDDPLAHETQALIDALIALAIDVSCEG